MSEPELKRSKVDSFLHSDIVEKLRPHQITAANFILERLLHSSDVSEDFPFPLTGAILADEMGTGKTLVAISVLYSICLQNSCKAVVVCPPILIANWQNELKKWLPRWGNMVVAVSSTASAKENDRIVHSFVTSSPAVLKLLIIGYEMFRTYAEALNTMNTLEVLVCDEGHRLKNAEGTKTIQALERCCATRRLVLTGTPIQNNLEELYAVVNFVVPGYLGTLKEFKKSYQDPIMKAREMDASDRCRREGAVCESRLRGLLSRVLLRRTKEMVLSAHLPPRTEFTVRISLSPQQRQQYLALAAEVLSCSSGSTLMTSSLEDLLVSVEGNNQKIDSFKGILPALLRLRMICDKAEVSGDATDKASISGVETSVTKESDESQFTKLLNSSTKLQTLDALLAAIFSETSSTVTESAQPSPPGSDRVVVVSNFTSVLDEVQTLCRLRRWSALKIDGSVTEDRRTLRIQHFNNPKGVFRVMLLSARAGGIGISLVGGCRLVLMEPDWNPAVDQQAMGRVWRDGQTKEVFVYRMICSGTIEETILSRQADKSSLSSVIKESEHDGGGEECLAANEVPSEVLGRNLTVAGLKALLLPDSTSHSTQATEDCCSKDSSLAACTKSCGTITSIEKV